MRLQIIKVMRVEPKPSSPDAKESSPTDPSRTRYKLILSDSERYAQAILGTQSSPLISTGQVKQWGIVETEKSLSCVQVNGSKILMVPTLTAKENPGRKIGTPSAEQPSDQQAMEAKPLTAPKAAAASTPPSRDTNRSESRKRERDAKEAWSSSSPRDTKSPPTPPNQPLVSPIPMLELVDMPTGRTYCPLKMLSPLVKGRWTIKVRVTDKGGIKHIKSKNGADTKLFSVTLLDAESTEMRATMFGDACEARFDQFDAGDV